MAVHHQWLVGVTGDVISGINDRLAAFRHVDLAYHADLNQPSTPESTLN